MPNKEGKYNIKAVSKLLGIQPGTLRAWERRYGIISPGRSESGHRVYSESQVEILRQITGMIGQGFTVGQAVAQIGKRPIVKRVGNNRAESRLEEYRNDLMDAFRHFDEERAHRVIDGLLSHFTFETALAAIFHPLLKEMDRFLEKGILNNACFLFGSALIRSRIESAALVAGRNRLLPRFLLLCAPGEQKEIWLQLLTGFLRLKGYEAIYLGAGIAGEDIDLAFMEINPAFAIFSCQTVSGAEEIFAMLNKWERLFPGVRIGAFGQGFQFAASEKIDNPVLPLNLGEAPGEWEEWLNQQLDGDKPFTNNPH